LTKHFNDSLFVLLTGIVRLQGSGEVNQHSVVEDLPAASLLQTPGARADATTWCDESGHVWLFGGEGYDDDAYSVQPKLLNDLWLFNSSRLEWNVMHSGRTQSTFSTDGGENTKSVKVEAQQDVTSVAPKPRKRAASCGVPGIVFVVFGGIESNGSSLTDTWIYAIKKAMWLPLSGRNISHPATPWSTRISWCHLDALYVIGNSRDNVTEMWKFSLRTLKWSNETLYLIKQQRCANDSLPITLPSTADSISIVWNGTYYLYQWQIIHGGSESNPLMLSVDLQRWQSFPSIMFRNSLHGTPMLWSDMNSFNSGSVACSSPDIFQQSHDCSGGKSCNLHRSYQIMSSTLWPEQRLHTSSWFYGDNVYIFGGRAVDSDSKTLFNDLYILQQSDISISTHFVLVLSFVIALVVFILSGFGVFCISRYCDYHRGRKKSRELRIRYTPLRDQTLYE